MTKVLVPLAEGVEEIEAAIIIDTLRRAKWEVMAAGVTAMPITASRGMIILPDAPWDDVATESYDALVIPGGAKGVENLINDPRVLDTVRHYFRRDKWLAAVCAGPLVLQAAGVLTKKNATCHPMVAHSLTVTPWINKPVVIDDRIITSQGPGTCFQFALTIVSLIAGAALANRIREEMVVPKE